MSTAFFTWWPAILQETTRSQSGNMNAATTSVSCSWQATYHRDHRIMRLEGSYKAIKSNPLLDSGIQSKQICQVIIQVFLECLQCWSAHRLPRLLVEATCHHAVSTRLTSQDIWGLSEKTLNQPREDLESSTIHFFLSFSSSSLPLFWSSTSWSNCHLSELSQHKGRGVKLRASCPFQTDMFLSLDSLTRDDL